MQCTLELEKGGGEFFFSQFVLQMCPPCALPLAQEIRNQSTTAAFMIEPVYVHVWFVRVFVSLERSDSAPRGTFLYAFQAPHFKWIFGVCCFTTYPGCTAALP